MSPLERLLLAPWSPLPAAAVLFVHGWVIWFVLGREFRRTLFMAVASRAVVGAGAWWLHASGALGRQEAAWEPGRADWFAAAATAWLLCWCLDAAVLGRLMRRFLPGWSWKAYDLMVLGVAQSAYLAGSWFLLG